MASRARDVLTQYETALEALMPGRAGMSAGSFVLRHADVEADEGTRPRGIKRGTPKECFRNAALLCHRRELDYCEGYVVLKDIALPIHHAWCVDKATGRVVDNTLEDPSRFSYLGVSIPRRVLWKELNRTGVYGLLDTGVGYNLKFMESFERKYGKSDLAL